MHQLSQVLGDVLSSAAPRSWETSSNAAMGSALSFCSVEQRSPKVPPNLNCSPALSTLLYMKQPPKRGDLQELRLLHPSKTPWDLPHPQSRPQVPRHPPDVPGHQFSTWGPEMREGFLLAAELQAEERWSWRKEKPHSSPTSRVSSPRSSCRSGW